MKKTSKFKKIYLTKAQGMTEYILIVALIALVAVGAIQIFGEKIKSKVEAVTEALG
ncbi:MAG: hypothetical protein LBF97_02880 [Elusimicrobiota bacterium]|jgi:Flp pilus assembly pilin Flp|nr:hypothetical protein [Elusimicrobiota bacterium]